MKRRPWQMSRRAFLRGAGATVALPFLDAMIPPNASAQTMTGPRRLLVYFTPNGFNMSRWRPTRTGTNYQLSAALDLTRVEGAAHMQQRLRRVVAMISKLR